MMRRQGPADHVGKDLHWGTMNVTPQISYRNFEAIPGLRERIEQEVSKLEKHYDRIVACRVMMEVPHRKRGEGNTFHTRIRVTVPGREIVVSRHPNGNQALADPFVAVRDAFAAMRRRLEDHSNRVRNQVKTHEPPPHGHVSRVFPQDGYGFITTPDGREVYFHENSVLNGDFARLEVGTEVRFAEDVGLEGPQASSVRLVGKHHIME